MANLNLTPLLNDVYAALVSAGVQRVYRPTPGSPLPESLPSTFVVLWPLFGNVSEDWATRKGVSKRVQVSCWSTGPGTAWALAETVQQALPSSRFTIDGFGPEQSDGQHIGVPVTVMTVE